MAADAAPDLRREVNLNIAHVAATFGTSADFEFLCECGHPGCGELVSLSLEQFSAANHPLLAPIHHQAA